MMKCEILLSEIFKLDTSIVGVWLKLYWSMHLCMMF